MKVTLTNHHDLMTYVWTGPCSLTLERYDGEAWEANASPWSGCPNCGVAREIPDPLFLEPGAADHIDWDQLVATCEDDTIVTEPASGRFRFVFQYAQDEPGCRSASDPLECWTQYRDKEWHRAYSSEFTLEGPADM